MKNILKIFSVIFLFAVITLIYGCGKKMPEDKFIGGRSYPLINQDGGRVNFPEDFKNEIVVIGFIYTHCPDICPLTTHNLQTVQTELKKDGIKNVRILALSFDPERDTPPVLKEFGDVRDVDYSNFQFLTGKRSVIDSLIHEMDVIAIPGDSTNVDGKTAYFFSHSDKISLVDQNGKIRNEYRGSKASVQEIISDIKKLGD